MRPYLDYQRQLFTITPATRRTLQRERRSWVRVAVAVLCVIGAGIGWLI